MKLEFPSAEKICGIKNPLSWTSEKQQIFVDACREFAVFHNEQNSDIKKLYERYAFDPRTIVKEEDIARIPTLGVTAMKYYLLTSLPHEQVVLRLTSSGTRGQKTQIWFDQDSLDRVQRMLDVCLDQEGMVSKDLCNYLVLNYDPEDAGDLGVAYTNRNQLRFAPKKEVHYAIKKSSQGVWVFDKDKCLEKVRGFLEQAIPLRIFGMPAFLLEFLEHIQTKKVQLPKAKANSWIMTGGGWKAAEDKKITRAQLREMCFDAFGIPTSHQRDAYGMAEHCAPYFECKDHAFHIGVFNRIIIRDPETMSVLPDGEVGLMELVTPFNAMMPNLAILTTDYGRVLKSECTCGQKSPTFEVIGRAGISKHKGCAMTASDIVRRV